MESIVKNEISNFLSEKYQLMLTQRQLLKCSTTKAIFEGCEGCYYYSVHLSLGNNCGNKTSLRLKTTIWGDFREHQSSTKSYYFDEADSTKNKQLFGSFCEELIDCLKISQ